MGVNRSSKSEELARGAAVRGKKKRFCRQDVQYEKVGADYSSVGSGVDMRAAVRIEAAHSAARHA